MLQNNITIDGKFISMGDLVVNVQYLFSIQENTNWDWKKQPLQKNIIVTTCTTINPRLDVVGITDVQDIPKTVCNRIQEENIHTKTSYFSDRF